MQHNIVIIWIFMLSEGFDLMFPRFWHSGETSRLVSQFIFWRWKEILDLFFTLRYTFFFFIFSADSSSCLFVPVAIVHQSEMFSLLATVTRRECFRVSDEIVWNWFPSSRWNTYDGITSGWWKTCCCFNMTKLRWTMEYREGHRHFFPCDWF